MSANTITYEVHVKEGGRWVTQGHYGRGDREEALAHARSIERLKKQTVKVVRETFWAATNQVEHVIVYRSEPQAPTAPPPAQRKEAPKGGAARKTAVKKAAEPAPQPVPPPSELAAEPAAPPAKPGLRSSFRTFGKGVGIVTGSMLAGLAVMSILAKLIDLFDSPTLSMNKTPILLVAYVAAVLLTALPLLLRLLGQPRRVAAARPAPAPEPVLAEPEASPPVEDSPALPPPAKAPPMEVSPSSLADAFVAEARAAWDADEEVLTALLEETLPEAPSPEETLPPLTADQQFAELRAAVTTALSQGGGETDPHGAIGAGLVLAGGADRLRGKEGVDDGRLAVLLAEALDGLGPETGFARTFLDQLEESVQRPHYRNMLAAGYLLIDDIAQSRQGDPGRVRLYLDAWMTPVEAAPVVEEQAVILVSCLHPRAIAAFHEGKGEILAELHGEMIRRSLILYSGTLVSLSPEQAVVRFFWSAQAVEAAIAIQDAAKIRNRETAEDAFDLAIGLDGGTVLAGVPEAMAPLIASANAAAQAAQPAEIRCTRSIFEQTSADAFTLTPVPPGNPDAAVFKVSWG